MLIDDFEVTNTTEMPKYEYAPLECADRKNMFSFESAFTYNEKPPEYTTTEPVKPGCCATIIHWLVTVVCFVLTILLFPLIGCFAIKIVRDYERMIIFRLGIMQRQRSAGVTLVLPCVDKCHRVDMRMRAFSVPPRQVRLRNDAVVELGCEVHFRIDNAVRCILNVTDLNGSLRVLAQTTLVNRVTKLRFDELEFGKADCAKELVADLNGTTRTWGVSVQRCEISQLKVVSLANSLTFANGAPGPAAAPQPSANPMQFGPAMLGMPPQMAAGRGAPGAGAGAPAMPFAPIMSSGVNSGHAELIGQLVQHFLPGLTQLFGNVNQTVATSPPSNTTSTTTLSEPTAAAASKPSDAVLIDVGSMHQAAMAMNAGGPILAPPTAAPALKSSALATKIDTLIQVAQRTLLDDSTLRCHLNALYLFKIYPGGQLGGTPNACYILDAKTPMQRDASGAAASASASAGAGGDTTTGNQKKADAESQPAARADMRIQIDSSLSISEEDLDALFEGRLNTWQAFLQGRVQVDGDMNAALRLTELVDKMKTKFF